MEEELIFEEVGAETDADIKATPEAFHQAVIWSTDWTAETISLQLEKKNIDLNPEFQRRDAWSDTEKSKLIESLILGIPVPTIILAENKHVKNSFIVLDGKQRLLSIRRFYADINDEFFKPLKLTGLDVLKELNGCYISDIGEEYKRNLDNYPIRTVVIKNWPSEKYLYTVFHRLNTGSKPLSPQELRQALKPGKFLTYLDNATSSSDAIHKMLKTEKPDPRMKDIELALRYFAFKYNIENFTGNLKDFLDGTCDLINKKWETEKSRVAEDFKALEDSIMFAFVLMESSNPFGRYSGTERMRQFNRSIFELFSYYFSDAAVRICVLDHKDVFISKFIELNNDPEFIAAVSDTTKDPAKVEMRFGLFAALLKSIPDMCEINMIKRTEHGFIVERK